MTGDPTIITPDNLPEIGEMVECVKHDPEQCVINGGKYKVEGIKDERDIVFTCDHLRLQTYDAEYFRRLPENVKQATNPHAVTILVDDELLIPSFKKLLEHNGIRYAFHMTLQDVTVGFIPHPNDIGLLACSLNRSGDGIPLSNWKEVRRRIEELVKPKETTVRMSYGGVAKINSENVAFWVGEMSIFEATKKDLQTILEQMK